jgi:septal ring-binding cell division protein DamX
VSDLRQRVNALQRLSDRRAENDRRAESDRQALSRRPNARYAVQLELACEIETLDKAWAWDKPAGTMWLLTTQYRGRTCFRVLWGRYATVSQAQAARAKIPSFFVVPGNRPVAVSVRYHRGCASRSPVEKFRADALSFSLPVC